MGHVGAAAISPCPRYSRVDFIDPYKEPKTAPQAAALHAIIFCIDGGGYPREFVAGYLARLGDPAHPIF